MSQLSEKEFCLAFMRADTEDEVIKLLSDAGYWGDEKAWRFLGDNSNNQSIVGAQQSKSDAALVEKLVNSIDARLMNECQKNEIALDGPKSPKNIRLAVAQFIEKSPNPDRSRSGRIKYWDDSFRREKSKEITLAATGSRRNPCFSIADKGEGQTPKSVPNTFLSLIKDNKVKIPFVPGKFNMGGTGVLRFCGKNKLQFILTRRNPKIINGSSKDPTDSNWSFTVVKKDEPKGSDRSSVYRYLAPVKSESCPGKGGLLNFFSNEMPIFPEGNIAYKRKSEYGSLIKLYEYSAKGFTSHILMPDGLLARMDLLLPSPALPIRFHECRDYSLLRPLVV